MTLRLQRSTWASGYRALLTPAELQVAELAARGLSNPSIAAARSCTTRTVANQLARVYEKLRLSGRRELRACLGAQQLRGSETPAPATTPGEQHPASSGLRMTIQRTRLPAPHTCLGDMVEAIFDGLLSVQKDRSNGPEELWLARINSPALALKHALSPRERQILMLAAQGMSNKVTAYELGLSLSSVSTYLRRAREKSGIEQVALLLGRLPSPLGRHAAELGRAS